MFRFLRDWFAGDRTGRLDRLMRLAAAMDELLIVGPLQPDTRQQLQTARDGLEDRIRELLVAG